MRSILPLASLAACALALAAPAAAQVYCVRTHDVLEPIALADCVVTGEVVEVGAKEVVLAVERRIAGEAPERVRVRRLPVEYCGIWRWAEYAVGQRVLTFLDAPDDAEQPWSVCGDTEWPLLGEDAVVPGIRVEGYAEEDHAIGAAECRGSRVAVAEIAAAIAGFRGAFACAPEDRYDTFVTSIEFRDPAAALALRDASRTGLFLYERATASELFRSSRARPLLPADAPMLLAPAGGRDPAFGRPLAFVGDVDGDGIADLAAGGAADPAHPRQGGALSLLFLAPDGSARSRVAIEGLPIGAIEPLGDLDGDGVPDLVAIEPDSFDDEDEERSLLVLFLTREGRVRRSVEVRDHPALRSVGVGSDFEIGSALAVLGDLDGDGGPELVLGTRYPRPKGPSFAWLARETAEERRARLAEVRVGCVLISLDRAGEVRHARAIGAFPVGLGDAGWGEPGALEGVGDVDGDGTPDLAVGKPGTAYGADHRGAVWIVTLRPDGEPKGARRIVDLGPGELREGSRFGLALAAPGDVDGDGVPDLVAASVGALHVLFLRRDGGLREHRSASVDPDGDFHLFRPALACDRRDPPGKPRRLAVGDQLGDWDEDVGAVLQLEIAPEGSLRAR